MEFKLTIFTCKYILFVGLQNSGGTVHINIFKLTGRFQIVMAAGLGDRMTSTGF